MSEALKQRKNVVISLLRRLLDKQHPFYVGRYYLINIMVYLLLSAIIFKFTFSDETVSNWWVLSLVPLFLHRFRYILMGSVLLTITALYTFWSELSWHYLIALPAVIYMGHLTAVFIHNAVHKGFKPVWLNPIIGELCALQQLSAGFPVFRKIHSAHHAFSDDPVKDPHPPKGYTFWEYVDESRNLIKNWLTRSYLKQWGDSSESRRLWSIQNTLLLVSRFSKTLFWFALLGPKFFVLLYLPSYLSNVFLFAAFNYFSHREKGDGTMEVLNLDSNLYYRVCNKTLFGIMYHKNHHLKPRIFNPVLMPSQETTE